MSIPTLADVDFLPWEQPNPNTEPRELLTSWLRYQRHEFIRKLRDLSPEQLVAWSVPPVELSVLGLVRHMTQMEHFYLSWGFGGGERSLRYGDDDYAGGAVETIEHDLRWYFAEVALSDAAVAQVPSLDTAGAGHGRPLRATLIKMIDEYAIHAGQAHMIRFAALGKLVR